MRVVKISISLSKTEFERSSLEDVMDEKLTLWTKNCPIGHFDPSIFVKSKSDLTISFCVSMRIFYVSIIFFYDKYEASCDPISDNFLYDVPYYSVTSFSDYFQYIALKLCREIQGTMKQIFYYKRDTAMLSAH